MPEHIQHKHNFLFIAIAVVLVVLAALVFMFMSIYYESEVQITETLLQNNNAATAPPQPPSSAAGGLGAEIYEQSSKNPIKDSVPGLAPATNPIEGAYQNPFE